MLNGNITSVIFAVSAGAGFWSSVVSDMPWMAVGFLLLTPFELLLASTGVYKERVAHAAKHRADANLKDAQARSEERLLSEGDRLELNDIKSKMAIMQVKFDEIKNQVDSNR